MSISLMDVIGNVMIGSIASKALSKVVGEKKATAIVMVAAAATYVIPKISNRISNPKASNSETTVESEGGIKGLFKKTVKPKEHTVTVANMEWERHIRVEKFVTETKSGWKLEDGAYDVITERKPKDIKQAAEFASQFGSVSVPIVKDDIYYIYKVDKWAFEMTRVVKGEGAYDDTKFTAAWNDLNTAFDQTVKPDMKAKDGDTRKKAQNIIYRMTLVDDETGDIYTYEMSNKNLYDLFSVGGKAIVTLGGVTTKYVKTIRKKVQDEEAETPTDATVETGETSNPETV